MSYSLRAMFLSISKTNNLKSVRELIDRDKTLKSRISVLSVFSLLLGFFFS